jgi:hypothetical protein
VMELTADASHVIDLTLRFSLSTLRSRLLTPFFPPSLGHGEHAQCVDGGQQLVRSGGEDDHPTRRHQGLPEGQRGVRSMSVKRAETRSMQQ